jgi:class I fructose-bisphosphate aldolase
MDHAEVMNVSKNLENPGEIITKAVNSGVDALLTTFDVAQHFQKEIGRVGHILRIDGGTTKKILQEKFLVKLQKCLMWKMQYV